MDKRIKEISLTVEMMMIIIIIGVILYNLNTSNVSFMEKEEIAIVHHVFMYHNWKPPRPLQ